MSLPAKPCTEAQDDSPKGEVCADLRSGPSLLGAKRRTAPGGTRVLSRRDEWNELVYIYKRTVQKTYGMGKSGQLYIDSAHQKLVDFAARHTDEDFQIPKRDFCRDDGLGGFGGALFSVAHVFRS